MTYLSGLLLLALILQRRLLFFVPLLLLTMGGGAYAQSAPVDVPGFDTTTLHLLGSSVLTLGFTVFTVVASIKRWTEVQGTPVKLNPWAWRGLSFAVGLLAAFILHASGFGAQLPLFGTTGVVAVLLYGLFAGLAAMFGRDTAKTLISWVTIGLAAALASRPVPTTVGEILPPAGVINPPTVPITDVNGKQVGTITNSGLEPAK